MTDEDKRKLAESLLKEIIKRPAMLDDLIKRLEELDNKTVNEID